MQPAGHTQFYTTLTDATLKTDTDAYFGRAETIIKQRERIKRKTIEHRRLQHRQIAA